MENTKNNLHNGHRQRLKKRFVAEGLSSFEDHQALELLLFFAIPRCDTNELAHKLIASFGSLRNMFEADIADIMNVGGVGENTAILIKLLPEIASKYWFTPAQSGTQISSINSAAAFFKTLLYGKPVEHFYIVCLNSSYQVKISACLSRGTPSQTPVFIRHIVEAVMRSHTEMVLIAHNHPGGSVSPSKKDIEMTIDIQTALDSMQVRLLDHLILSDNEYFSFAAQRLIKSNYTPEQAHAAKYSAGLMNNAGLNSNQKK